MNIIQKESDMKSLIFLFGILIISVSCKPVSPVHEEQTLLNTDKDFAKISIQNGIYEAYSRFLDDDATIEKESGDEIHGRKTILDSIAKYPRNLILSWEPTFVKILIPNNLGMTMGRFILNEKENDTIRQISKGKYLDLWKKTGDGKWKLYYDVGMSCGEK